MSDQKNLEEKYKSVADAIRAYPAQLKDAWDKISALNFPHDYKLVNNVVLCGMGGSALGGRMVDSLVSDRLRIPFEIFTEYNIPNYVNDKTLVIASSYSGTTEETLKCTYDALNKNAKIFGITTGGKLGEIFKENNLPHFIIDEKYNPSKQPRMSLGYAAGSILALFGNLGFINVSQDEIDEAIKAMNDTLTQFNENTGDSSNLAKNYAEKLKGKVPVLISSEHLSGCAHAIKNQLNENAKTFSLIFDIPELNHHLMEGLAHPEKIRDLFLFMFFESKLYTEKVIKRYSITGEVIKKNGFSYETYEVYSEKKLSQMFEMLILGSFIAYYLAKLYKINITEIPWVDYFKERLAKS